MPRVLFIAQHRPGRSPGQRFRFEQYLGHLERHGYTCELSQLVGEEEDRWLYRRGHRLRKLRFVWRGFAKRMEEARHLDDYDIVFVFREALMTRSTRFERAVARSRASFIFDFDDAIWLPNVSEANRNWAWVKDPGKTARLIAMADLVFAGNAYLADYALRHNKSVEIVPTTIDTEEYVPVERAASGPVVIGWSGSITTIQHFQYAVPALRALKERFGERIAFRVVGDGAFREASLGITGLPWRKESELDDLRAMDIGIMPLPDDEWAQGKCGLKGLQYMALGIPTIMSPVGVNSAIISDGVNGFLAATTEEWVDRIARLVEDAGLRQRLGRAARLTVEERYSTNAWQDTYVRLFDQLLSTNTPSDDRPRTHPAHARP